MDTKSCNICCETYNKSSHAPICCPNKDCAYQACKECTRTYLLNKTTGPHCMNCNQAWSNYFIVTNLNKSFVESTYTDHRATVLMELEKSKMPDTMNAVNNYVKGEDLEKEARDIDKELTELRRQCSVLHNSRQNKLTQAIALKSGKAVTGERKKFIMPCPADDCRGFLSTGYKCEACKNHACPHCLDVLGPNPNHVQHTCDPDAVKTAELIKSTTKPCPKCGERISKIEGCDQMWCVSCHTAFGWKTGTIETGTVHNPHYYQFQRQVNNGEVARNPGDVLCGGLPNWFGTRRNMRSKWIPPTTSTNHNVEHVAEFSSLIELAEKIHRTVAHVTHAELPTARRAVRDAHDHKLLRIKYILNRISEKEMGQTIGTIDKRSMKDNELLHIYELFSVVGIELFVAIQDKVNSVPNADEISILDMTKFMKEKMNEFIRFVNYSNNQLRMISISYSCSVPITRIVGRDCSIYRRKQTLKSFKESQLENSTQQIAILT